MKKLLILLLLTLTYCSPEIGDVEVDINYAIPNYTLSVTAGDGGSVSSEGGSFEAGKVVAITATANPEYVFSGWSNGSTENPLSVTMNSDQILSASFDEVIYILSETELAVAIIEEEEKLMGKWNFDFNSEGSASRSIATCNMNWIEFNPDRKFIFKLTVTGDNSSLRFISGYYNITYKDPTADGVAFDKIMLFYDDISDENAQQLEGGDIATLSDYTFNIANLGSYEVGADFTFKPEILLGEYCETTPQELSAFQEPLDITEEVDPLSYMAKIANNWRYSEATSIYIDSGNSVGYGAGTNGLCVFLYYETDRLCTNANGETIQNCEFLGNQVNDATLSISKYGSYIITYYNGNSSVTSYFEGTWRRYGEPNSEGNYTQIQVIETEKLKAYGDTFDIWLNYGVVHTIDYVDIDLGQFMFNRPDLNLNGVKERFVMKPEAAPHTIFSCPAYILDGK